MRWSIIYPILKNTKISPIFYVYFKILLLHIIENIGLHSDMSTFEHTQQELQLIRVQLEDCIFVYERELAERNEDISTATDKLRALNEETDVLENILLNKKEECRAHLAEKVNHITLCEYP